MTTDTEVRAFVVAYEKACNHRYDMDAIRAGLEAAAKVRFPDTGALREVLTDARNAIASLEEGDLGYHERAPHEHWPIRDELLSKIDAALTKGEG